MSDTAPTVETLQRELELERRAHSYTRSQHAQAVLDLAGATLTAEELLGLLRDATAPAAPEDSAQEDVSAIA